MKDFHYIEQIRKLYTIKIKPIPKLNQDLIKVYDKHLGYPSASQDFIHVTGTNGKGTFCSSLSESLLKISQKNLKIGTFMSPHVSTFRERIQINNEMIEKQYITRFLEKAYKDIEKLRIQISYFDLLTLMAFSYFRENNVDLGIIEVGMGGFTDSTNIIQKPILSVITTIGLDHEAFLGNTTEKIAYQKSGIIKNGSKVLIGNMVNKDIILNRMHDVKVPISDLHEIPTELQDYNEFNFHLHKKSQEIQSNSWAPLKQYEDNSNLTDESKIRKNFDQRQKLKCRFEKIDEKNVKLSLFACKNVFLDVGHNEQGIRETLKLDKINNAVRKIHILYGAKSKKDLKNIFDVLLQFSHKIEKIYFIYSEGSGSMKSEDFSRQAIELKFDMPYDILADGDINTTLDFLLKEKLKNEDQLQTLGSFSVMKDVRKYFEMQEEVDPYNLNEMAFDVTDTSNLVL